jgi:hypothetical protein
MVPSSANKQRVTIAHPPAASIFCPFKLGSPGLPTEAINESIWELSSDAERGYLGLLANIVELVSPGLPPEFVEEAGCELSTDANCCLDREFKAATVLGTLRYACGGTHTTSGGGEDQK